MNKIRPTSPHRNLALLYALGVSIVITGIFATVPTHAGMVLLLVTVVTALILRYRMRTNRRMDSAINVALLIGLVAIGLIVLLSSPPPIKDWLASCYAVFDVILLVELFLSPSTPR